MSFNWSEFYSQIASGVFLLVMTGLVGVLGWLGWILKDFPKLIKQVDMHEKRHDVNNDLWTAHIGTIIKTEVIAEDQSEFPFKKWKLKTDEA